MSIFSQLFILLSIFGVMYMAVQVLPPIVQAWKAKYFSEESKAARKKQTAKSRSAIRVSRTSLLAGAAVIGLAMWALLQTPMPLVFLVGVALFGPKVVDALLSERRIQQFDAQLLDGLILMNNALRSGLDIVTGIELISTNMPPPIADEFAQTLNAYRLGKPLEEALRDLSSRVGSRTLETAVTSINIQREMGGNLIKTFEQLIVTLREESKLQKKIQALSAQGRTQIFVLAVLPWAVALFFYFMSPEMIKPAIENTTGQFVLMGLVVWEIIGILVTKKIVTVDV